MTSFPLLLLLLFLSIPLTTAQASLQCMYTIAGNGTRGSSGDGGAATEAGLACPASVELYRDGFLIGDHYNHAIRFVNATSGIITTVVGTLGSGSFGGDGGPATAATLSFPYRVTQYAGGLLITDQMNDAVRFVNGSTGVISTVAGRGLSSPGDGGPATAALLNDPYAVAVNGSDFFIADTRNFRIRRVGSDGIITTIAGLGASGFGSDGGTATLSFITQVFDIAMSAAHGLLFADRETNRIRLIDNDIITTVAGGGLSSGSGPATSIALNQPRGVISNGGAGIIIADSYNHRIRFSNASAYMTIIAGAGTAGYSGDGGPATAAEVNLPCGMALDGYGGLLIADYDNHAIRYMTPPGMCSPLVNCGIVAPNVTCTFSPVAPYLYLSASLSGARCTLLQAAPATIRNVTCPLPYGTAATGNLTWTVGNVASSTTIAVPTRTPTSSISAAASASATRSSTEAQTATSSSTPTPTSSETSSGTMTATCTSTVAPVSGSASVSSSGSMTSSSSPVLPSTSLASSATSTAAPPGAPLLSLALSTARSPVTASSPPLQLRDVDAPLSLTARVLSCNTVSSCILACSTSNSDVMRVYPTATFVSDVVDVTVSIWARYGVLAASSAALLVCSVERVTDPASSSRVSITVRITPVSLPLVTDVLLHVTRLPVVRSVWSSAACNISAADMSSMSSFTVGSALPSFSLFSAAAAAVSYDATVLASCARSARAPSHVYQLTCIGGSNVTLVAGDGRFNADIHSVRIGSQPVAASRISGDGKLMHIQLPSSLSLCGSYECGYVPLTIGASVVNLTCPGFCASSNGTVPQCGTSCAAADVGDGSMPPLRKSTSASSGVFITSSCDLAVYTDPSTGACSNASDLASARCAFGAGDACSPCPSNALCPGGFRAWPLPGFYTPLEASGVVAACPPPATRCGGWDAERAAVACATAYRYGSYMCSTCAVGFYADIDGSCVVCPSTPSPIIAIIPFAIFIGYILAALLGLYVLMLGIALAVKSRTDDIRGRVVGLAASSFTTVQLVAQAGKTAAAGLPSSLLVMYTALAVSQFDGIVLPSSCIAGYPFTREVAVMSIGVAALVVVACLAASASTGACSHVHAAALRTCIVFLTLIYATLVNSALSLVSCTSIRITVQAYLALDGDGSTLVRGGVSLTSSPSASTLIDVLIQASNPSRVCYESSHTPAAALAWVALTTVGIIFPTVCVWCVYLRVRAHLAAEERRGEHDHKQSLSRSWTQASLYEPSGTLVVGSLDGRRPGPPPVSHAPLAVGTHSPTQVMVDDDCTVKHHNALVIVQQRCNQADVPSAAPAHKHSRSLPVAVVTAATTPTNEANRYHLLGIDDDLRVLRDALLTPFVQADYRPSAFAFYAVDRYVILCLGIITATLRSTTDAVIILIRASLLFLVLLTNAALILRYSPFQPREWWKRAVKLLTIGLTCAITALNAMTNMLTILSSAQGVPLSRTSSDAITGGAYLVFALCVCTLAALPLTFILNAIHPPPRIIMKTELQQAALKVLPDERTIRPSSVGAPPVGDEVGSNDHTADIMMMLNHVRHAAAFSRSTSTRERQAFSQVYSRKRVALSAAKHGKQAHKLRVGAIADVKLVME